jgi:hypothetical protein
MDNIMMIFVGILVVSYILLYLSGRYYLREGFGNPRWAGMNNVPPPPPPQ